MSALLESPQSIVRVCLVFELTSSHNFVIWLIVYNTWSPHWHFWPFAYAQISSQIRLKYIIIPLSHDCTRPSRDWKICQLLYIPGLHGKCTAKVRECSSWEKSCWQFPALLQELGLMEWWWVVDVVADECGTERTRREVNSSALTCEELHYPAITSLTYSPFPSRAASQYRAVTISLLPTGPDSRFNHSRCAEIYHIIFLCFQKSVRVFRAQYRSQFDGTVVNTPLWLDRQSCGHFKSSYTERTAKNVTANFCHLAQRQKAVQTKIKRTLHYYITSLSAADGWCVTAEAMLCHCHYAQQLHGWLYWLCPKTHPLPLQHSPICI